MARVNFTWVLLSCNHSQPRSIASLRPALYSAGELLKSDRNGRFIFSMWIRPSCTGSTELAISSNLRAATSGVQPLDAAAIPIPRRLDAR
jgi:hypothetical protein